MPKAKSKPTKITDNSTHLTALPVKSQKGKTSPIKDTSKVIKKTAKSEIVKTTLNKPPVFQRPSASPKRPSNAYIIFNAEMMQQMKSMDKFKDVSHKQRMNVVSQSWSKLTSDQIQEYTKCALEDKQRYADELTQFEKKGFFINKEGIDSRDIYKSPKETKQDPQDLKDQEEDKDGDEEMEGDAQKKKAIKIKQEDDDVCKPKKPMTKFILFSNENRIKVLKQNPDMFITDIAKQNGEDWKKVTDAQLKKYEKLSENEKVRYAKEIKEFEETGFFTNSDGVNSKFMDKKHRVQEFEKGTMMPKKVQSAYMIYFIEQHNEMKVQVKDDEKYSVIQKTKDLSEKWKAMTALKKQKYEKLSLKDGERYQNQLDEMRNNGFYLTEDGVKSTDLVQKQKKIKKVKVDIIQQSD